MLKSMTGYGSSNLENEEYTINTEIKTVNSKYLDCSLRLPKLFADKEIEVKNLAQKILERGKVYINLNYVSKTENTSQLVVNQQLVNGYYEAMLKSAHELNAPTNDIFRIAMMQDNVFIQKANEEVITSHWKAIYQTIEKALLDCNEFRKDEGKSLQNHIQECLTSIQNSLAEINKIEPRRMEKIRQKLEKNIESVISSEHFDRNRFEQEVIYYAEKLDIAEEQVRLKTHIDYFVKELSKVESTTTTSGKKLNFIAQEMGREINTIGSKANDADMQYFVVEMKEELEKIKEQTLNVL